MKGGILIFLILIQIVLVSAVQINLKKEVFQPGETFLATVTGGILETIPKENVFFYREYGGHVQVQIPYDIAKINNIYYIYAILPDTEQEYTLEIKDVYHHDSGYIGVQDFAVNFSTEGETAAFNIDPGFIISNKNFSITINNNLDSEINVTSSFYGSEQTIELLPKQSAEIDFSIADIEETLITNILFSSSNFNYDIRAYIIKGGNVVKNKTKLKKEIGFDPATIEATINKGQNYFFSIELVNLGEENITNITFRYPEEFEDFLTLQPSSIDELGPNKKREIDIVFTPTSMGNFSGILEAVSGNISTAFNMSFVVQENVTTNSTILIKSCTDIGGEVCSSDELCDGEITLTSDYEVCCKGSCNPIEKEKGQKRANILLSVVVIAVLIIILIIILKKTRKPRKTSEEILKEKSKSYSERYETSESLER